MSRILGIESSCDETAVAMVEDRAGELVIEQNLIASQAALHATWGGVVPEVAARQHAQTLFPLLVEACIPQTGEGIDAIAVTNGPGLAPALRVGVEAAKALAWLWGKPIIPINHLEGHISSVFFGETVPAFPALVLIVSGGHTEWVYMTGFGDYTLLGSTRDDAAGEAFDKVAKLLGLGYPGGAALSKLAIEGNPEAIHFPRAMLKSGDLDVSFSGLKTAVSVFVAQHPHVSKADIAASFQAAVVDTLVAKTRAALKEREVLSLIVTGGVSANGPLRRAMSELAQTFNISLFLPELALTGDNAAMIAAAGALRWRKGEKDTSWQTIVASPSLTMT